MTASKKTNKRVSKRRKTKSKKLQPAASSAEPGGEQSPDHGGAQREAAGRPRRKRGGRGRRRASTPGATTRAQVVAQSDSVTSAEAVPPEGPQIETQDDAIIIRFPPAGRKADSLENRNGLQERTLPAVEEERPAAGDTPSSRKRGKGRRGRRRKQPGKVQASVVEGAADAAARADDRQREETAEQAGDWREEMELDAVELSGAREGATATAIPVETLETAPLTTESAEALKSPAEETEAAAQAEATAPRKRRRRRRRKKRATAAEAEPEEPPAVQEQAQPSTTFEPARSGKEMVINVAQREECRIAILEGGRLEEIYIERASAENSVGNIYKGVVTNVEPSIQAAFIDFGMGKNGFLHISDLHPQYFPDSDRQEEKVGRKMPRRVRPPIQRCLRRGREVVVQITKEGIGTKGPTLSTYLSIPGRYLVMLPGMRRVGVSRKIEDDDQRQKVREQLNELTLPEEMGFIARTAASGRTRRELQSDLSYLQRLWKAVERRMEQDRAPAELYRESDLVTRTIRDVFTSDIDRIVVDDAEVAERAREFLSIFSPRSRDIAVVYDEPTPIFHKYGIEAELERLHSRHVPLKSGGSLVIDQTEALVAIDVNSGRFRTEEDAEITAYKINQEAADEIARQLRLRDLGGVIVCDFIDLRQEKHRRSLERRLSRNLRAHKERAKVLRMSQFGLIELTRQRQRASLTRAVYQDCRHCRGTGLVKTAESVTLDVMRILQLATTREHVRSIEVTVSPSVGELLQNRKRSVLHASESGNNCTITIRQDPGYALDQVDVQCYDSRGRLAPYSG